MKKRELHDRVADLERQLAATRKLVAGQASTIGPRTPAPVGMTWVGYMPGSGDSPGSDVYAGVGPADPNPAITRKLAGAVLAAYPMKAYRAPDPADTAKVGDPDPTSRLGSPSCTAKFPRDDEPWPWSCTRHPDHRGQHVAGDSDTVKHVWPNEDEPIREWETSLVPDPLPDGYVRVCPRCGHDVEALPPRRICDECTIEVGARPRLYVGMTISGQDAVMHLPDGVVLVADGLTSSAQRTMGEPIPGAWQQRGVYPHGDYRVVSLPPDRAAMQDTVDRIKALSVQTAQIRSIGDVERDAATVAAAEQHGNEIGQRDRTAAIEGAAITLRAHILNEHGPRASCRCGWGAEFIVPADGDRSKGHYPGPDEYARHVAEQLAAVDALGGRAARAPHLVEGDRLHCRVTGPTSDVWHTGTVAVGDFAADLVVHVDAKRPF